MVTNLIFFKQTKTGQGNVLICFEDALLLIDAELLVDVDSITDLFLKKVFILGTLFSALLLASWQCLTPAQWVSHSVKQNCDLVRNCMLQMLHLIHLPKESLSFT